MPLFRFHRGSLQDSLNTTIKVKNMEELRQACQPFVNEMFWMKDSNNFSLNIEPYPSIHLCFDSRIGWYTHLVTLTVHNPDNPHVKNINCAPIGFLSENLENENG